MMAQMKITLENMDIALAVSEWAEKHHGIKITPSYVVVATKKTMKGNGLTEKEVHIPNIFFEIVPTSDGK
jgi:hypothetical protein